MSWNLSAALKGQNEQKVKARRRYLLSALKRAYDDGVFSGNEDRVFVFGSLVHGEFHLRSDVDLAVEGEDVFLIAGKLYRYFESEDDFDVIPLDPDTPSVIKEAVYKYGKDIKSFLEESFS